MSDQEQQEVQQSIQLGFGQAMTQMYGSNWRETVSEGDVNRARHFYHKGLNDLQIAVQVSNAQLSQSVHNLFSTLTAGAEKQIAEQQAALSTDPVDALSTHQVGALNADQVKALSAADLKKMKPAKAPAKAKPAAKPAKKATAKGRK